MFGLCAPLQLSRQCSYELFSPFIPHQVLLVQIPKLLSILLICNENYIVCLTINCQLIQCLAFACDCNSLADAHMNFSPFYHTLGFVGLNPKIDIQIKYFFVMKIILLDQLIITNAGHIQCSAFACQCNILADAHLIFHLFYLTPVLVSTNPKLSLKYISTKGRVQLDLILIKNVKDTKFNRI